MSTINHQKLRELAFALQRMATPQNYWHFAQCSRRLLCWHCWISWSTPEPRLLPFASRSIMKSLISAQRWGHLANRKRRKQCSKSCCNASITFLIFSEPVRNQNMHTQKNRLPCRNRSGYISAAPHKTGAGILNPIQSKAHNRASGFLCVLYCHVFFASELWRGVRGRLRSGRILCSPVLRTLYVSPPRDSQLWMVSYFYHRAKRPHHGRPQTAPRYRGASSHPD